MLIVLGVQFLLLCTWIGLSSGNTLGKTCYHAKICIHNGLEKCGVHSNGTFRKFLDSCDMKEYNCLRGTDFVKTSIENCALLSDIEETDARILGDRNVTEGTETAIPNGNILENAQSNNTNTDIDVNTVEEKENEYNNLEEQSNDEDNASDKEIKDDKDINEVEAEDDETIDDEPMLDKSSDQEEIEESTEETEEEQEEDENLDEDVVEDSELETEEDKRLDNNSMQNESSAVNDESSIKVNIYENESLSQ